MSHPFQTAIVTGASRGFGRAIAAALVAKGADVVGIARDGEALRAVRDELGDRFTPVAADATDEALARDLIHERRPGLLVLNAGVTPHMAPVHEQTWETFSRNWHTDTRHAFAWIRAALREPLAPGSVVVAMSSGAALAGSPLSGGYASAKAAIRYLRGYAADESERAGLGIRFAALLPQLTPATGLGSTGVEAYAARNGVDRETRGGAADRQSVRAWRGFDRFEGRSSVRRWLYTIATRACLTALETRSRRPLPSGLGAPSEDYRVAPAAREPSVAWLQPGPDSLFGGDDPAAVVAGRTGVRLAFIAALQFLSARQRAVLTLRDVLAFRTAEVAEMLDTTAEAVDSVLRRARARMAEAGPVAEDLAEPDEEERRRLLDGYVDAFTRADPDALVKLLRADVELEMPPIPTWFSGRDAVVGFLAGRVMRAGHWYMVPTSANAQPGLVVYRRGDGGRYEAYGVQVLTLIGARIARITSFNDPALVPAFGFAPEFTP